MVQLTRIYTKSGDKGKTALGNGTRVPKNSVRVEAYGTVDETNAFIGVARLHADGDIDAMLARIQNDLFDLGADLCTPGDGSDDNPEQPALRITATQTERLEQEIDQINAGLDPLKSFVLPGGSALSAQLHVVRTVSRRAERLIANWPGSSRSTRNAFVISTGCRTICLFLPATQITAARMTFCGNPA
jgi:cob(I)alamin adenosyltransferase